jgi:hypothetical protein
MKIRNLLPITYAVVLFANLNSCQLKENKPVKAHSPKEFACKQSFEDICTYLPINAIGDSVVIGDKHMFQVDYGPKADSGAYVEVMTRHKFADNRIIWDCKTDTNFTFKYTDHTLTYGNKRLIVSSDRRFVYYDPTSQSVKAKYIPAYRQEVYAVNGTLKVTEPVMILKPLAYPASTKKFARAIYDSLARIPGAKLDLTMADDLLVAALSGDKLAEKRLLGLETKFAIEDDDRKLLAERLEFYNDYKKSKKAARKN